MDRLFRTPVCIAICAIGITGCVDPDLTERLTRVEQRLDTVETSLAKLSSDLSRLQSLYGTDLPLPNRSKAELQAHIGRLEQQRAALLTNITPQHPTIRDIDRQIRMLRWQMGALERAITPGSKASDQPQQAGPAQAR